MKTTKELLNMLPSSWKEVTLKDFKKIGDIGITEEGFMTENEDVFVGVQNSLSIISVFTGLSVDELEALPMNTIQQMGNKLAFTLKLPEVAGLPPTKLKTIENVTFNDYIRFIQLSENPMANMTEIIQTFCVEQLSVEEIENWDMQTAMEFFFALETYTRKFMKHTIQKAKLKLKMLKAKKRLIRCKEKISDWLVS